MLINMYLSAKDAAAALVISLPTLYAYVSRGMLRAHPGATPRESRYEAAAVERLAHERSRSRRPKEVARAALDFGLPVLESALTAIHAGRFFYRGRDAVSFAMRATLEETAALLWNLPTSGETSPMTPPAGDTLLARFAAGPEDESTGTWMIEPERLGAGCIAIVRRLAGCLLQQAPIAAPLHEQCAQAWNIPADHGDLLRMALVLCADHELNASSFTVRCVASTGATLHAAVVGGLAALSGPRHGNMTARVEAFWDAIDFARPEKSLRTWLTTSEDVPGFGHPLYPHGDPRASALLGSLPHGTELAKVIEQVTGRKPNLDFGLVALRRQLNLPHGTAFGLFALGRSVGWIAHALEQRATGQLIRPRAVYVGPDVVSTS